MSLLFHIVQIIFLFSVSARAEYGAAVRPNGFDGNVVFKAAIFKSGASNFLTVGRAYNGGYFSGLISAFLLSGGWADSSFVKNSTSWYPGQRFYDFTNSEFENLCTAGVYAYDGYIVACRSMKLNGFYEVYLAKFNEAGSLMTNFGTNGLVATGIGGDSSDWHGFVRGIVYNDDVNTTNYGIVTIVGGVGTQAPDNFHPYIASFDQATGAAYGSVTSISGVSGTAVAIAYSSGYYVAATTTAAPHSFKVYKYSHDGGTPTTLNIDWSQTSIDFSDAGGGTEAVPTAIVTDGTDVYVVGSEKDDSSTPPWRCAVVDLLASNGNINTNYGDVTITGGTDSEGYSIFSHDGANPDDDCILNGAVMDGTDLIVLGTAYHGDNDNYDTYSAKLDNTGALVGTYGSSGHKVVAIGSGDDIWYSGFIDSSVLYVVGRAHNADLYQGGIIQRLNPATGAYYKTVTSIATEADDISFPVGQTGTLTVTATYSDLTTATIPSASLLWSSSDTSKMTVSAAGVATMLNTGCAITATTGSGGFSDDASILGMSAQNVFITSSTFTGNIPNVYAADMYCEIDAYNNGLVGGPWRAILSTEATAASSRISVSSTVYNFRGDGAGGEQIVAMDSTEFWSGTITSAMNYTIAGSAINGNIWTGSTSTGGISAGNTCTSWTSTSNNGAYGSSSSTSNYLNSNTAACTTAYRLYCISGQSAHAAPSTPSAFAKVTAGRTRANFSFTSGGGTTAGYKLAYRLGGTAPTSCALNTTVHPFTIGPMPSSYSVDGLTAGKQYSFRACASNSDVSSLSSGLTATFTTPTVDARVFVSDDTYTGNIGGIYVADMQCQSDALDAGYTGVFKAILSTEATAASSRISVTQPIYNTRKIADGGPQRVADNSTEFFSASITSAMNYRTSGAAVNGSVRTGSTTTGGIDAGNTCTSWTSTSNSGSIGTSSSTTVHYNANTGSCNSSYRIYCVGAQSASAAPADPASFSETSNTSTTESFSFTSGGGTTAGYKIAYQTGGTAPASCSAGTTISPFTIGPGATSYTVTGLTANTQYSFRLCASNSDASAFSTGLTATVTTDP